MNTVKSFKEIVLKQHQNVDKVVGSWEGNMIEYLEKVQKNPSIASFASNRIYNMIMSYGTEEVNDDLKTKGYDDLIKYNFFHKNGIFGSFEPIHDLMKFLKAAAYKTETGKRILLMVGPVSSGKSTISSMIKRGLELDKTEKYAIKGCPIHEEPLHVIPHVDRPYWENLLNIKIEGNVCPVCQHMIDEKYTNEKGIVEWDRIPVKLIKFSEQKRIGIGTFQPSDPNTQDVTELIGRTNISKISMYGETDPRAYEFNGELQVANGGMIEYIEMIKADIKLHYVLITATQEQLIKSPGFPQMYIDTLIIGHTNEVEFDSFKANKKNEALHDRMYKVNVPWNLRLKDEIKIYKKMIQESQFKDIHIAPNTLEIAAQFAILSRLTDSTIVTSKIEKMKIYNGETIKQTKKTDVDVKSLIEEGRSNNEGMNGISPRFIINALDIALGKKENKNCINPIDMIRALRDQFNHHIGIDEENKERYITMLMGNKDSVSSEFKETAKKEVNMAFIRSYEEQANELFDRYLKNINAFCKKEKIIDSITGEYMDPDEKIMRSIEELIGIPLESKTEFRSGIFVFKSDHQERNLPFTFKDYDPIREAIEKKLMLDLKNVVGLSLGDTTSTNPKSSKRRKDAFDVLLKKGYCKECANVLLSFIGEILRRV